MATLFSARRKPKRIARDDMAPGQADAEEEGKPNLHLVRPTHNIFPNSHFPSLVSKSRPVAHDV